MLSLQRLARWVDQGDHERLLAELSDHGGTLPMPVRLGLARSPQAGTALVLRRVMELTYGPTPLVRRLVAALLDSSADPQGGTIEQGLSWAAAAAGWGRLAREPWHAGLAPGAEHEHANALDRLAGLLDPMTGLLQPRGRLNRIDTDTTLLYNAWIAFLLADDTHARTHPVLGRLWAALADIPSPLPGQAEQLWLMAQWAIQATPVSRSAA